MPGKNRKVSEEEVLKAVQLFSSDSESETEPLDIAVFLEKTEPVSPSADCTSTPDPAKNPAKNPTETSEKTLPQPKLLLPQPSDEEKTTEEEDSSSILPPPSLPESDKEGKTPQKDSSPTLPRPLPPESVEKEKTAQKDSSPSLPRPSPPPPETVGNTQPSSQPSGEIITNIMDLYPAVNDIRNQLKFSRDFAKDTNFFQFKIREMDRDVGRSLSQKIGRIPILSGYTKETIDNYKKNSTRGDVSFKIRYLCKILNLFLEKLKSH